MDSKVDDDQIELVLVEDAATINRLPAEILHQIFALAVHSGAASQIPRHPTTKLPWILGQVCSGWRELAYSDSNLWKHFHYTIYRKFKFDNPLADQDQQQSLRRLDALLPYGLGSFTVHSYAWSSTARISLEYPVLSTLKTLHLELPLASLVNSLTACPPYFSNLEEVGLIARGFFDSPDECLPGLKLLDVFSVTKHVSKLTFGGWLPSFFLNIPNIPWSQLIQLDLLGARLHPQQLFRVLCECIILQNLSYQAESTSDPPYVAHGPFLRELKSLTLGYFENAAVIPFPWKQLESLTFRQRRVSHIKILLEAAQVIESLSVIEPYKSECPMEGPPLLVKSLRSLTFKYGDIFLEQESCLDHLLTDHIIAPNLEALHILHMHDEPPFQAPRVSRILPLIEHAQENLITFRFDHPVIQDANTPDSYLRDLVKALRSLREFTAPHMIFNRRLLNEMKQNHLLPNVQRLEIRVASTVTFAKMVEARVDKSLKEEGFIRLKKAYGYYPESYHTAKLRDESKALGRLKRLNALYGTEFGLIAVGVKGPYGRFHIREDYV
ncbi:hypothetical protein H0H93_001142 [Arthromyces matolae]|nr:hypothetical protein H0H93_001142 [Arthromyces matolae]